METVTTETTAVLTKEEKINNFAASLSRSTNQIKGDRAQEISELLELDAKREVENRERDVIILERKKKSSIDLSPDNTYSIMKVKDFDPIEFVDAYNTLGLQIREAKIKLNNAKQTYNELFGNTFTLEILN